MRCVALISLVSCAPPSNGILQITLTDDGPFRDLTAHVTPGMADITWRIDGQEVDYGATVPATDVLPGQRWTATATSALGAQQTSRDVVIGEPLGGNVLVILFDDIGIDHIGAYDDNPLAPATPVIDGLAAEGVRFDRAYASPVCSPTRGILMTGRHARRTGLGWIADTGLRTFALPLDALTIPEALEDAWSTPWDTSAIGKWHMAGPLAEGVLTHPLDQGFGWFEGTVGNPPYGSRGYEDWDENVNGVVSQNTTYLTTESIDDALDRIDVMPEPWFLYLALHAAHTPLSPPPADLVSGTMASDDDNALFDATIEAMDTEIGRLFDQMGSVYDRTTIFAIGDNGSPSHAVDAPLDPDRAKHTVYEGGIHVPFIVAGPHVDQPGSVSDALVHVADVYATVLNLAGVPLGGPPEALEVHITEAIPVDGRSLLPQLADPTAEGHETLYVEAFNPNGDRETRGIDRRALRDDRFKLVRLGDEQEYFYDLGIVGQRDDGPELSNDLGPAAAAARARLRAELDDIEATLQFEGF